MKPKTISTLTNITSYNSEDQDITQAYFPKMENFSPIVYYPLVNGKKKSTPFGKKYKLVEELYGLHIAYRKGCDSFASSIIWNCINVLKPNHVSLLMDTFENTLPKNIDIKNEDQRLYFQLLLINMWEMFFDRLDGFTIVKDEKSYNFYSTNNFDRTIADNKSKYSDVYKTVLSNLRCALKIEHKEKDPYQHFCEFMYLEE